MKNILLLCGLVTGLSASLFAGETLQLKLVPERGVLLKNHPQEVVIKIDLSAITRKRKIHHPSLNLAVVLDKSGSMTGAKLEKTKQAAIMLVDRLKPRDIFSLVVFSDRARMLVPAQHVRDKDALKEKIESIEAGGNTALYAGVKLGADQLEELFSDRRINRVILLSDGLANVGPSSTRQLRRLGRNLAERGMSVTTIGVGDDYNEDLMAGLAQASDANYYYVQNTEKLPRIFARELGGLLTVAARDVRIRVICPDGVKPLGFIGRAEKFKGQQALVNLSQFTGGQNRYLLLRCLVNGDHPEVVRVHVNYKDEFDNDREQSTSGTAKIAFTDSQKLSDKSVNHAVVADKELILTAVAKDEAMAQADAGNYQKAATILAAQGGVLNASYAGASAAAKSQIRLELHNLENFTNQLDQGQYDPGTRKLMQWQSFNTRNSK